MDSIGDIASIGDTVSDVVASVVGNAIFFIVFITRQDTGHSFSAGETCLNWQPGDIVELPYYCNHATSNAGFTPKMLVQCLGIRNDVAI